MPVNLPPAIPADSILAPNAAGIARAAQLLTAGKLVILPTETVYGIALALSSSTARHAARLIKANAAGPGATPSPWVIHVAQPDDVLGWVPNLSPLGRRLVTKALPGPVAFEIKLDAGAQALAEKRLGDAAGETLHDGYITLRCPDFGTTQEVLAAVPDPVAIIGTGTSAQPSVYELTDLPPAAPGSPQVDAALDGGPTRYRRPSTLVRIDGEQFSVVRPGVLDERILTRLADFTILFVCSGNTCRSPMAAAIAGKMLAEKLHIPVSELPLRHIVVKSAGLHANKGMRAAVEAVDAVQAFGADLSTHFSQPVTPDLLRRADVIYTMTADHRDEILDLLPGAQRKTFPVDPEGDIVDPIGSPLPVYQHVAQRLSNVLQGRLSELSL